MLTARKIRPDPQGGWGTLDAGLARASRIAMIAVAVVVTVAALSAARTVLVPVSLAIVIGLMFGPYADRIERSGVSPAVSAAAVVLTFILVIAASVVAFGIPLADWLDLLPQVWRKLKLTLLELRGWFDAFDSLTEQLRALTGADRTVAVADDAMARDLAFLAPGLVGQLVVFLASMYFFIATRHGIRATVLRLCLGRRLRLRVARVFRDVEIAVSRYLLSISLVNAGLGAAVALAMALIGVPSAIFWGLLAAMLNYVIYVGPAVMAAILLGVGMATMPEGWAVLAPAATYLGINFVEAQFVTPYVLGSRLTVNPFIVLLSIVFWLWLWGPAGGFLAVPFVLILSVFASHMMAIAAEPPGRSPAALQRDPAPLRSSGSREKLALPL